LGEKNYAMLEPEATSGRLISANHRMVWFGWGSIVELFHSWKET